MGAGGEGGEGGREGGRETLADSSREGGWTGNNREAKPAATLKPSERKERVDGDGGMRRESGTCEE